MSAAAITNAGPKASNPSETRPIAPNTPVINHATNQPQLATWLPDRDSRELNIGCAIRVSMHPRAVRSRNDQPELVA